MPLKINSLAPDFTLPSTEGGDFLLSDQLEKPLVLYFYPKDFTSVCTKQACSFRDHFFELSKLSVSVWGVSRDSIRTHLRFKAEHNLPFELLSDESGKVAKLYDARIPIVGVTKRVTYLINGDGRIAGVHGRLFGGDSHVSEMLKALS